MSSRDAVTYLLMDEASDPGVIVGYSALSSGEVRRAAAPDNLSQGAPDPIPAIRMGRFAVDERCHGQGIGRELLAEALLGAVHAGRVIGARVMLVDAIDEQARAFYLRFGFMPSPVHDLQVLHDLRVVAASAGLDQPTKR